MEAISLPQFQPPPPDRGALVEANLRHNKEMALSPCQIQGWDTSTCPVELESGQEWPLASGQNGASGPLCFRQELLS